MKIPTQELRWINIFIRDCLLIIVIVVVDYLTYFRSRWVAFIMGMLVVWITWQFSDYIKYKKLKRWNLNGKV